MKIEYIEAIELLDSRGNPTVGVKLVDNKGNIGFAIAPSGASTGKYEAFELRDGDKKVYNGKGTKKAVENVNKTIFENVCNKCFCDQRSFDEMLLELDGTENKSKLGANGQVLVGCLASIACMKFLPEKYPSISNALLILIMLICSIIAACIWSVIPAIFKAFFNTNETLFTLMMNYIALTLVDYFVFTWDKTGSGNIGIVNLLNGQKGWIPDIGNKYVLSIIFAVVLAVIMYIYMKFTKHGFEVQLVGESVNTAKYVGINVKKVIIRTLFFGGIICGILGFLYAGSVSHTINQEVGGLGFTAILVAWLASFDPAIMLLTSFFVVFLDTGSKYVSTQFQLNSNDYANIVVGIIFFFVIGCEFFIRFKLQLNKKCPKNNEGKVS